MPPLPADSIHARACKLKCEKILTRPKGHPYLEVFGIENITISIIGKPRNTCGFDRKKGQKEKKTPCFFRKARCFYNMKRIVILTEALECSWDRRSFP